MILLEIIYDAYVIYEIFILQCLRFVKKSYLVTSNRTVIYTLNGFSFGCSNKSREMIATNKALTVLW